MPFPKRARPLLGAKRLGAPGWRWGPGLFCVPAGRPFLISPQGALAFSSAAQRNLHKAKPLGRLLDVRIPIPWAMSTILGPVRARVGGPGAEPPAPRRWPKACAEHALPPCPWRFPVPREDRANPWPPRLWPSPVDLCSWIWRCSFSFWGCSFFVFSSDGACVASPDVSCVLPVHPSSSQEFPVPGVSPSGLECPLSKEGLYWRLGDVNGAGRGSGRGRGVGAWSREKRPRRHKRRGQGYVHQL